MPEESIHHINFDQLNKKAISQPLIKHIYTADPSAHVFNGKIYIYPSHEVDGRYYLFFPAKDHDGIFKIGVATSDSPTGPFIPQPEAIQKSFSIDPAVFKDACQDSEDG